jgi:hypothetical protein
MKVNLTKEIGDNTLISHIVLTGMTDALMEHLVDKREADEDHIVNFKLTVNDKHEIDIQKFCEEWESQVERMIKEEAKKLVKQNMFDISNKLDDLRETMTSLEEQLDDKVDDILKEWKR